MVIQWGCLAKCQGTRKGGLEFRRISATAAAAALAWWLFVQKFHVCVQRFVRSANVEERTFRDNTGELSEKFPESRIYQLGDTKREIRNVKNPRRCFINVHVY